MASDTDKAKAVLVAVEWFKAVECVNVELGLIKDRTECEQCSAAFLTIIEDILNGTEPSLRNKDRSA